MVIVSWYNNLWRASRKSTREPKGPVIGILAFEVVSLMSRVVRLWQCLGDKQFDRLRDEIVNSIGVKRLVSEDDGFLMDLVFAELMENLGFVASSVARLGKRCTDPVYYRLENVFSAPDNNAEWFGWEYKWKKMERKVRKMERFIDVTGQLYQELDVLAELEQSFRRMQGNADIEQVKLLEFQQKVMWQRREVRNLSEASPWNRTYDYIISLLARSIFTILEKIKHVFGINQIPFADAREDTDHMEASLFSRSLSIQSFLPFDDSSSRFFSGSLKRSVSTLSITAVKGRTGRERKATHLQSSTSHVKNPQLKTKHFAAIGPFKGCMVSAGNSPILKSCTPSAGHLKSSSAHIRSVSKIKNTSVEPLSCRCRIDCKLSLFTPKYGLFTAPQSTLGNSALALHYANIIILIEKLVSSPHSMSLDTIDDLYNMLPTTLRAALRAKLKPWLKTLGSFVYDSTLASDWSSIVVRTLEWLAPLAHNMIRWQSERNFEKQHIGSRTNILLVQTIYFADQAKTEDAIMELLMGLNYVWRFKGKQTSKAVPAENASYEEQWRDQ